MAAKSAWAAFPHDAKDFACARDALRKTGPNLHAGDLEPYLDAQRAATLLAAADRLRPTASMPTSWPRHCNKPGARSITAPSVRVALDTTLEIAPKHAEAHTAMALYDAEIIGKVGAMIGGRAYGAKAAEADKHIKTALKLIPDSPIAHIEHGNVLMLLHGSQQERAAAAAYEKAAKLKPLDAMDALDAAYARTQLE